MGYHCLNMRFYGSAMPFPHVQGAFRLHGEFATAVALMRAGLIDPARLITHTAPLDRAEDAFRLAADRRVAMKTQIAFD